MNGVFADLPAVFPTYHCLTRRWQTGAAANSTSGNMLAAQYSPAQIQYILSSASTFVQVKSSIEDHPHNALHAAISGDMYDPRTSVSKIYVLL